MLRFFARFAILLWAALAAVPQLPAQADVSSVTVSLAPGWNAVAFQCQTVTSLTAGAGITALAYFDGSQYQLRAFTREEINAAGTSRAFWVLVTSATALTYSGTGRATQLNLVSGWNLVSLASDLDVSGSGLLCYRDNQLVPLGSALLTTFYELGSNGVSTGVAAGSATLRRDRAYWIFANSAVRLTWAGPAPMPTPTPSASPGPSQGGSLYVLSSSPAAVYRFANPRLLNGSATPTATLSGAATRLSSPVSMYLDTGNDRLYVANSGPTDTLLVWDQASTRNGNVAPSRVVTLDGVDAFTVEDLTVDTAKGRGYLIDSTRQLILSVPGVDTANTRVSALTFLSTASFTPSALASDPGGDRLYVADRGTNPSIQVFDSASTRSGTTSPTKILTSELNRPRDLLLNGGTQLLVSDGNTLNRIFSFNPIEAQGAFTPIQTLQGSETRLGTLTIVRLALDSGRGDVYASTLEGILAFNGFLGMPGTQNRAPDRVLTGYSGVALAVDPTR